MFFSFLNARKISSFAILGHVFFGDFSYNPKNPDPSRMASF